MLRDPTCLTRTTACLGFWAILTFSAQLLSSPPTCFSPALPRGTWSRAIGFKPSSLGLPGVLDSWTPQFPQIQFGNTFSGQGSYAPLGATQNSGEATFPENNGSLTVDVNKSFKAHSVSIGYLGIWQTDRRRQTDPDGIEFLASP